MRSSPFRMPESTAVLASGAGASDAEGRSLAALQAATELVDDFRARLALNVSYDLACEALAFRLERALG